MAAPTWARWDRIVGRQTKERAGRQYPGHCTAAAAAGREGTDHRPLDRIDCTGGRKGPSHIPAVAAVAGQCRDQAEPDTKDSDSAAMEDKQKWSGQSMALLEGCSIGPAGRCETVDGGRIPRRQ
jgi:hypothetical protein